MNFKTIITTALILASLTFSVYADGIQPCDGFPNANFSIGGNVSRNGGIFNVIIYNPPSFGAKLQTAGGGQFKFTVDGTTIEDEKFSQKAVTRNWPFANVKLSDAKFNNLSFNIKTFAPAAINNPFATSLPVLMAEITIKNLSNTDSQTAVIEFAAEKLIKEAKETETPKVKGIRGNGLFAGWIKNGNSFKIDKSSIEVTVKAGKETTVCFIIARYEENLYVASELKSEVEIAEYAADNWCRLAIETAKLNSMIPATGDEKIDEYTRWYTTCGLLMTKTLRDGTMLNMGYTELNQRDSFWTSWVHLVFWPSVDKKMIEESAQHQRENGKIPTTILPTIERNDDIDINCFFILRINRYCKYYDDMKFAKKMFPHIQRAFKFLYSLDDTKSGLPMQHSFWADWKDVGGIEGRKYSPYASMLYLAALKESAALAEKIGEHKAAKELMENYHKGLKLLNTSVEQGGLYNGKYYQQVWYDSAKNNDKLLEDQVVGILYNVIDRSKSKTILEELKRSYTQWGPAETTPPYEKGFGYEPGDYHNGAVWPYLAHVHAWTLLKMGMKEEAAGIIKTVGYADLEKDGDFMPHEYVNGRTGKNDGPQIQGWNASLFATIYFGWTKHDMDKTDNFFLLRLLGL